MIPEKIAPEQHDTLDGIAAPAKNPFLIGHQTICDFFLNILSSKNFPHAFIFLGQRGIGKTTFAFHLVRHLLGKKTDSLKEFHKASLESSLFRQVALGVHPCVLYISRPLERSSSVKFKTALTVDEIRRINHFLSLTSDSSCIRTIIIDCVDDMNSSAANALLKNLEEPPAKTLFILISHAERSLLPTLRSRCQSVPFKSLSLEEFRSVLDLFPTFESQTSEAELKQLFEYSAGSIRKALMFLHHKGFAIMRSLHDLCSEGSKEKDAYNLAEMFIEDSAFFNIFNDMILYLLSSSALHAARSGYLERAKRFSTLWSEAQSQIAETKTYHLDKKQHAMMMIDRVRFVH